jgi:peroxiredoxin
MKTSIVCLFVSGLFLSVCSAQAAETKTIRAELQVPATRKPAPVFQLDNASGSKISNADFLGHVVLLDFWATECGGCRLEIPSFIGLQNVYRGQGLKAVGISMDIAYENLKSAKEAWARVNPFVREQGVNYPILMADPVVEKAYNVVGLPATYLIDKSGRIAAVYVGVVDKDDIEANIKRLLRE